MVAWGHDQFLVLAADVGVNCTEIGRIEIDLKIKSKIDFTPYLVVLLEE